MNELYICRDCETWHASYEELKHYDSTSGASAQHAVAPIFLLESEMDDDQKEFYIRRNTCSIQYDDSGS